MGQEIKEKRFKDGKIKERLSFRGGVLNGFQISYYSNGNVKSTGYFLEGLKEKVHETFYENGNLKSIKTFKQDLLHGVYEMYFENNQLYFSVLFENGKVMDGPILIFRPGGSVQVSGSVENCLPHGEWVWKDEEGYLQHKRCFKQSVPAGIWGDFYPNHQIMWKMDLDFDDWLVPYHEHYETGVLKHFGYFVRDSILKPRDVSFGHLYYNFTIENNIFINPELFSSKESIYKYLTMLKESFIINPYKDKEWLEYSNNRKLIFRREYDQNHPVGKWEEYSGASGVCISKIIPLNKSSNSYSLTEYYPSGEIQLDGSLEFSGEYFLSHRFRGLTINKSPDFSRIFRLESWTSLFGNHPVQITSMKKEMEPQAKSLFNKLGTWKEYFEDGRLKSETTYDPYSPNRQFIQFHPNGRLKFHGMYSGSKSGFLTFNEDGYLMKIEGYRELITQMFSEK